MNSNLFAFIVAVTNFAALLLIGVATFGVRRRIEEVYHATNSMKDALIRAARTEGEAQGRIDQRAENNIEAKAKARLENK